MKPKLIRGVWLLGVPALIMAAHFATAQDYTPHSTIPRTVIEYRTADPSFEAGEEAFIYFFNDLTAGQPDELTYSMSTDVGEFVVLVRNTKNGSCEPQPCPDTMTVLSWPDGYSVWPQEITVEEMSMGFVTVFEQIGS